jgi:hypothetical protein
MPEILDYDQTVKAGLAYDAPKPEVLDYDQVVKTGQAFDVPKPEVLDYNQVVKSGLAYDVQPAPAPQPAKPDFLQGSPADQLAWGTKVAPPAPTVPQVGTPTAIRRADGSTYTVNLQDATPDNADTPVPIPDTPYRASLRTGIEKDLGALQLANEQVDNSGFVKQTAGVLSGALKAVGSAIELSPLQYDNPHPPSSETDPLKISGERALLRREVLTKLAKSNDPADRAFAKELWGKNEYLTGQATPEIYPALSSALSTATLGIVNIPSDAVTPSQKAAGEAGGFVPMLIKHAPPNVIFKAASGTVGSMARGALAQLPAAESAFNKLASIPGISQIMSLPIRYAELQAGTAAVNALDARTIKRIQDDGIGDVMNQEVQRLTGFDPTTAAFAVLMSLRGVKPSDPGWQARREGLARAGLPEMATDAQIESGFWQSVNQSAKQFVDEAIPQQPVETRMPITEPTTPPAPEPTGTPVANAPSIDGFRYAEKQEQPGLAPHTMRTQLESGTEGKGQRVPANATGPGSRSYRVWSAADGHEVRLYNNGDIVVNDNGRQVFARKGDAQWLTPIDKSPTGTPVPAPIERRGGLEPVPGVQDPQAVFADLLAKKQAQEATLIPPNPRTNPALIPQEPPRQVVENAPGTTPTEKPPVATPAGEITPPQPAGEADAPINQLQKMSDVEFDNYQKKVYAESDKAKGTLAENLTPQQLATEKLVGNVQNERWRRNLTDVHPDELTKKFFDEVKNLGDEPTKPTVSEQEMLWRIDQIKNELKRQGKTASTEWLRQRIGNNADWKEVYVGLMEKADKWGLLFDSTQVTPAIKESLTPAQPKQPWEMKWDEVKAGLQEQRNTMPGIVAKAEQKYAEARTSFDADSQKRSKRLKAINNRIGRLNPTGDMDNVGSLAKRQIGELETERDGLIKDMRNAQAPMRSDFVKAETPESNLPSGQYEHINIIKKALVDGKPVPIDVLKDYANAEPPQEWAKVALSKMETPAQVGDKLSPAPAEPSGNSGQLPVELSGNAGQSLSSPGSARIETSPTDARTARVSIIDRIKSWVASKSDAYQSARDIVKQIETDFNVPIRGRATTAMRNALGHYEIKPELIRSRDVRSLSTITHELGHHIDRAMNDRMSLRPPTPEIGRELMKLGQDLYGKKQPVGGYKSEGWAEFIHDYLTGDQAPEKAPNTYKWFADTYLKDRPDIAAKLDKTKNMITAWRLQGAFGRMESQINRKTKTGTIGQRIRNVGLWVTDNFRDKNDILRRMVKDTGQELAPADDPFQIATFVQNKAGAKARQFVNEYTTNLAGEETGTSLRMIMRPIVDEGAVKDFTQYAIAKVELQNMARGMPTGIDRADAEFIVKQFDNPEWSKALDDVTAWNTRILDYVAESGGLEKSAIATMRELNPVYVPLFRAFEKGEKATSGGAGSSRLQQGSAVKSRRGSGREYIDPFESMIAQAERLISISHKAMVGRAMAGIADMQGMGKWIVKVPGPMKKTSFTAESLKKDIIAMAADHLGIDPADMPTDMKTWDQVLSVYTNADSYRGKDNIISIIKDGQRRWYEVHPDLYKTMQGLDAYRLPWFVDLTLGKATRALRLGATGLNASFGLIRNFWRDMWTFTTTAEHAKYGPFSAVAGVVKDVVNTPAAQRFKALGGKMAGQIGADRSAAQNLRSEALAGHYGKLSFYTVNHPVKAIQELIGVTEAGVRIAEFEPALKAAEAKYGKGSLSAAIEAFNAGQDVTTNFTRRGHIGGMLNEMSAFFNAAIQGPDKLYRTFTKHPVAATLKAVASLTVPAIGLWWMNKDEEWYKNLSAYEKANYLHFRIPGTERIIRLPIPFELGSLFQAMPVSAIDSMYHKDPTAFKEAFGQAMKKGNPIDWPAAIGPIIDVLQNKDFAGRPIVPRTLEAKLPEDQVKGYTTKLMQVIGHVTGASPVQLEYLANAYSGGLYSRVADSLQMASGQAQQELTATDLPIIGTIFMREPYAPKAKIERFYTTKQTLDQKHASGKLEGKEIGKYGLYGRIGKKLTPLWKALSVAKTEQQKRAIYEKVEILLNYTK